MDGQFPPFFPENRIENVEIKCRQVWLVFHTGQEKPYLRAATRYQPLIDPAPPAGPCRAQIDAPISSIL
jgi:hypothetical protein